jgi:hypothetical protein
VTLIRRGSLADHFEGVAAKRLSAVETDPKRSKQHEFNGVGTLRRLFGDDDRREVPARFVWLGKEQEGISEEGVISWYDARRAHPKRTEYRLYYPSNSVMNALVVPAGVQKTYTDARRSWLMDVTGFIAEAKARAITAPE